MYISILYYPAIMEFTTTTRGAPALVLNGFKYVVNRKNPNLFELIRTFQQEEASTHMTILQLATGGRSHPRKKRCVEMDRRIETMMQSFEDSTISLTDYLSGLSYLVCASVKIFGCILKLKDLVV